LPSYNLFRTWYLMKKDYCKNIWFFFLIHQESTLYFMVGHLSPINLLNGWKLRNEILIILKFIFKLGNSTTKYVAELQKSALFRQIWSYPLLHQLSLYLWWHIQNIFIFSKISKDLLLNFWYNLEHLKVNFILIFNVHV
jgi:hypothetical protein